jgi:hypothetical protein
VPKSQNDGFGGRLVGRVGRHIMKPFVRAIAITASLAGAFALAPDSAAAAGRGGSGFSGGHSGASHAGGGWSGGRSGGSWHGRSGGWHGGYWGRGGYWPYWGAVGIGLGIGAIGYYGGYWGGYYGPSPYYGAYYYDAPEVIVNPSYSTVEPGGGARSGQPVPQASTARAPEPIFYPRNGQSAATVESDRRECNRWATTQAGAMADASIFQRATFACMEGRGYTVR